MSVDKRVVKSLNHKSKVNQAVVLQAHIASSRSPSPSRGGDRSRSPSRERSSRPSSSSSTNETTQAELLPSSSSGPQQSKKNGKRNKLKAQIEESDSRDESRWQSTLEGGLKFGMSESVVMDGDKTLASERYNVKKEEKRLTREIDHLHDQQMRLCEQIKGHANSKAVEVYEKLLFKVRWADPEVSLAQQSLITDYVQHLLGPDPKRIFPGERVMRAMFDKNVGRRAEKAHGEILRLINRIRSIILYNDGKVADIKSALKEQESVLLRKKGGQLRWLMESNTGRKDRFWTTWYFASKGMAGPLQRHLKALKKRSDEAHLEQHGGGLEGEEGWNQRLARDEDWRKGITPTSKNDVDARDPDFGLTALHYASKTSNGQVVKVLLDFGANPNIRAPDGRTALHFAAAYGTRQVVTFLLGHEADIDAVDNFGCTAEVLAEQNENRPTWLVLQRWRTLVPELPARPVTPPVETVIPEAYQSVPEEVLDRMSKPLQAIARRLVPPDHMMEAAQDFMDERQGQQKEAEWQRFREMGVSESALETQDATLALEKEKRRLGYPDETVELTDEMRQQLEADKAGEEEKLHRTTTGFRKGGQSMSPIVELRLCQKFAEMCFREGFVEEGIRGLRRRWDSARKLLESSNNKLRKLHEHRQAHAKTTAHVHLQRRRESLHRKLGDPELQHQQALKGGGSDGASESSSAFDELSSVEESESTVDPRYAGTRGGEVDYTLHACVETGRELAEALIKYNQEGFAATVLEECLMLTGVPKLAQGEEAHRYDPLQHRNRDRRRVGGYSEGSASGDQVIPPQTNLEPSGTVALLARRCEVLLCVWDLLLKEQSETHRTLPFPPSSAAEYAEHYEEIRRESVQSLAETLSPSKATLVQGLAEQSSVSDFYRGRGNGTAMKPGGQLEQHSLASIDEMGIQVPVSSSPSHRSQSQSRSQEDHNSRPSEEDSSAWRDSDFKLTPTKAYLGLPEGESGELVAPMQQQPSVGSVESQDFVGFGYVGRNFQLYQRLLTVAVQCRDSIDLAIDITSAGAADLLVEPYVLVPLLELRAEVHEREEDFENSVVCLARAEDCCKRAVGTYTEETVAIMIELLRVLIKCETPEGYRAATEKATELTMIIDKIEEGKRRAREEEERKKTDIFEILRERKRQKEAQLERQRKFQEACAQGEALDNQVYSDPQKMAAAVEEEADAKRLGKSGRRGGLSIAPTRAEPEQEDTSGFFKRAMELISLAKLLDCKMETVPSLAGTGTGAAQEASHASGGGGGGGGGKRGAGAHKGARQGSSSSRMNPFSVVNEALGKGKAKGKSKGGNKGRDKGGVSFEDTASTVYTGRAPAKKDHSQTLSHPTEDVVTQDGRKTNVIKGSVSASTAPHEHIDRLGQASVAASEGPSDGHGHGGGPNQGSEAAVALAMAGLRASRMLSRPAYYQVPAEPRTKRVFAPAPVVELPPEKAIETSSTYYSQLQTRSLTHDVTRAAIQRSEQLQRELSSSLRFQAYESSFLADQAPLGSDAGTGGDVKRKNTKEKGVGLGEYDTTVEEAVLAGGQRASSVSAGSLRRAILPAARSASDIAPSEERDARDDNVGRLTRPDSPLTRVQKDSLLREQEADIDRVLRVSSASDFKPSPYDANPAALKAGFGSVAATASYNVDKSLSASQKLVLANVHGTINLANKHRLEQLVQSRPALAGLLTLGDKSGRRGGISNAGEGTAAWKSEDVLVERDASLVLGQGEGLVDAGAGAGTGASVEGGRSNAWGEGSAEEKEAAAAREFALSSHGVGSILHTGTAVVSIPHSSHAVAINPRTRKLPNNESAARAVSAAIALGESAGSPVSRSPVTKPRGRDMSSRKYSDKHSSSEGGTTAPLLRYKDGDWRVERQTEQQASQEMLQSTSLASLSQSIQEIEQERQRLHPDKSFYL